MLTAALRALRLTAQRPHGHVRHNIAAVVPAFNLPLETFMTPRLFSPIQLGGLELTHKVTTEVAESGTIHITFAR